jgi:membrane fusion protein, heavy metal efflux system
VVITRHPVPAVRLNGRMAWNEERTVRVYTPFGGRVERILVQPGEPVQKGQPLAVVSSPEFGQVQSEAQRAAADHALAAKNAERLRELEQNGVIARKELLAAEAELQRATAERDRTRARLALYAAKGNLVDQTYTLSSPIAGVVVERNINPGQELRPDQSGNGTPPLFLVTDPRSLWAVLDASEKDLGILTLGKTISVNSPAYRDQTFPARITAVSDFIDPATRTIKVRATLDNSHRKLKGEMFITAAVESEGASEIQVPEKAVFFQGGSHFIFVDEGNGRYARQPVDVGDTYQGIVEITGGVKDGQRVVTEGTLMLQQVLQPRRVMK